MAEQPDQRGFFRKVWDAVLGTRPAVDVTPLPLPINDNHAVDVTHLPKNIEQLKELPTQDKLLLSAVTASGCDAVAYYTPDAQGGFAITQHIDLYPERRTTFAPTLASFDAGSFASEGAVAQSANYQIPVYITDADRKPTSTLRGIIVLHAPQDGYSRVQTEEEKANPADMHEPVYIRKAKLDMAAHIVENHQDMLGGKTMDERVRRRIAELHHKTVDHKLEYFSQLAKDMFATLTSKDHVRPDDFEAVKNAQNASELIAAMRTASNQYDSTQTKHVLSVADLMKASVDAINKGQDKPVISDKQEQLIELLTLLHDIGKTQMSSSFMKPWQTVDKDEKPKLEEYFYERNHNHPLFTLLTLLTYEQDGITTGGHHHGFFRYNTQELEEKLGTGAFSDKSILREDIPRDKLPIMSKVLRVSDVAGSMMDSAGMPLDMALLELAKQAGYDATTKKVSPIDTSSKSIDPDMLCFMIDNGMFTSFAEKRVADESATEKGWFSEKFNKPKYDVAAVEAASKEILAAFDWQHRKDQASAKVRADIVSDPLLRENPVSATEKTRPAGQAR